jgi:formamidopyrimidine-DNA glycosylase
MSVELPEAYLLAAQMNKELAGKQVAAFDLQNCAKFQKMGFISKSQSDFERLCSHKIESAISRGNVIRLQLESGLNLLLAPEYGGIIRFHPKRNAIGAKYHLKLDFSDASVLTVTLTGMGVIKALTDSELQESYVYKRDFSSVASPLEESFTFERFSGELAGRNVNLKQVLVGKEAVVVGLGNSAFQDILYRARIDPKQKASELNEAERQSLFNAIGFVVKERIRLGGKDQFVDLYGKRGGYVPAMGPNMKGQPCPVCGTAVEKLSLGGGQVYCCPRCQK